MNYKEIVDKFRSIIWNHKIIQDFGYGELSDIKVVSQDEGGAGEADYPYAFLNPTSIQQNGSGRTLQFNLILMEMVLEDNFLQVQSDSIQYIDDIIGKFNRNSEDDITLQYSVTVFKERFQDEVAGATAQITVRTKEAKNECIAPFIIPPVLVLDVNSTSNQSFQPDVSGNPQAYPSITVDTYDGMRPSIANLYYIQGPETGKWVFTESGQAKKVSGAEPFINPRILTVRPNSGAEYPVLPTTTTFPDDSPIGETFNYTCTWEIELDPTLIDYVAIQDYDEPVTEPTYQTLSGLNLKATFQPA